MKKPASLTITRHDNEAIVSETIIEVLPKDNKMNSLDLANTMDTQLPRLPKHTLSDANIKILSKTKM